ncbi:MAG: alpha/beta hydrolase fold domain-containing protein, partial [Terrabacter sp.]|nr:alpha/beta hydrolase fold domain-containing protein [Terrabacter sp.]
MTTTREDPNRRHWEDVAAGRPSAWQALATEPDGVTVDPVAVPPGLRLRPPGADPRGVVLAIHGGGFVSGSPATHRRMFGHLARAARVEVVVPEYGLVPAQVFPDQPDAVLRAYRVVADGGGRVAVVGDSCGAMLAMGLAASLRDSGDPPPVGLLLMSAWTDLEATGASYDAGSDPFFTRDVV